jgi:hypothetical protein
MIWHIKTEKTAEDNEKCGDDSAPPPFQNGACQSGEQNCQGREERLRRKKRPYSLSGSSDYRREKYGVIKGLVIKRLIELAFVNFKSQIPVCGHIGEDGRIGNLHVIFQQFPAGLKPEKKGEQTEQKNRNKKPGSFFTVPFQGTAGISSVNPVWLRVSA